MKKRITHVMSLILLLITVISMFAFLTLGASAQNNFEISTKVSSAKIDTSSDEFFIAKKNAKVKDRASSISGTYFKFTESTLVLVCGETKDYYKLNLNGTVYYVDKKSLTPAGKTYDCSLIYTKKDAPTRPRPYEKADKFTSESKGTLLLKTGSVVNSYGHTWRVIFHRGVICFIYDNNVASVKEVKLSVSGAIDSILVDDKIEPSFEVTPNLNVKWSTSGKAVKVNSTTGEITGVSRGTAVVTASVSGIASLSFNINVNHRLLSNNEIDRAAKANGIKASDNAYKALHKINTYGEQLYSNRNKVLVFMFEGCGNNPDPSKRMNAMTVVVKGGKILYVNRSSSTIPDYPFEKSKTTNSKGMSTLRSGIYSYSTVNHTGYAALNVSKPSVVRFKSKTSFFVDTASGIDVHHRGSNSIAPKSGNWVNSAGCLLVGQSGKESSHEYARFIQSIGIVSSKSRGDAKYSTKISGKIVVDRSFAYDYLRGVGYNDEAINLIG